MQPSDGETGDAATTPATPASNPTPDVQAMQEEIARLRAEVAQLEAPPPRRRWSTGPRGVLAWVLVCLASACLVFSTLAIWLHEELFDTSRVMETVEPIVRDPAVATALSERVSAELVLALDIRGRAQQALPEQAKFLAGVMAGGAQTLVRTELERLFSSPRFQNVVLSAIRFAHQQIIAILRGTSQVVSIRDGVVTLNLFPLVDAGLRQIEVTGLLPSGVTLPSFTGAEAPSAARQQLSQSLGVTLPADFGEIALFESSELEQAKRGVRLFDRLVYVLPTVTLALMAGALALSPHRRRTALQLGLGAAIALLFTRLVIRLTARAVKSAAEADLTSGAVVSAAVDSLMGSLVSFTNVLVVIGVLVALVAFLLGRRPWLVAAWQRIRGLAGRGPSAATVLRWANDHTDALRITGVTVAVAALFAIRLDWSVFLGGVLLLIFYQLALSFVQGRRPPPDAIPPAGEAAST